MMYIDEGTEYALGYEVTKEGHSTHQHSHHQQWRPVDMVRGSYFHHPSAPIYQNHKFHACHFFIVNFNPNARVFHCAAKLEPVTLGPNNQWIQDLFAEHNAHRAVVDGGLEIASVEILLPDGFGLTNRNQDLPDDLWDNILERFLQSPTLVDFIEQWENH